MTRVLDVAERENDMSFFKAQGSCNDQAQHGSELGPIDFGRRLGTPVDVFDPIFLVNFA